MSHSGERINRHYRNTSDKKWGKKEVMPKHERCAFSQMDYQSISVEFNQDITFLFKILLTSEDEQRWGKCWEQSDETPRLCWAKFKSVNDVWQTIVWYASNRWRCNDSRFSMIMIHQKNNQIKYRNHYVDIWVSCFVFQCQNKHYDNFTLSDVTHRTYQE